MQHVSDSDLYAEIQKYIDKLDKKIAQVSKKIGGFLDDGLSQGFGIYITYADCFQKGEYKDFKEVMEIAESKMSDDKKAKKERMAAKFDQ